MTSSAESMAPRRFDRNHVSLLDPRSCPSIPANILYRICLAVGDDWGDNLARKHRKNLNILAMMDVSRSWRDDIVGFDDVFRDIAFDTSDDRTIVAATRILQIIEARTTELRVFIRSAFHDLIGHTKLQVNTKELLRRLGLQSSRFVYFELQSRSSHLSPYFNLPAPKLHFLRHDCVMPPVLFSSSFPNLRTLHTHMSQVAGIPSHAVFNLVELRLINHFRARRFSVELVLNLLRDTRQLEVLELSGFSQFDCVFTTIEPVELASLKSVQFTDSHLPELLPRLRFPKLHKFSFRGIDSTLDKNSSPSTVRNTDFFSLLQACPLPILDQRVLTNIIISTDEKDSKIEFTLQLVSGPPGPKHEFVITISWEKWASWEEHLERLIRGAMERIRFASAICLYLFHHVDHVHAPYLPLLRLPQISILCTSGCFTPVAFKLLTGSGNVAFPPPLPRLKCFCFRGDHLCLSANEVHLSVELCLQSRFDGGRPLAIRRWVPYGDTVEWMTAVVPEPELSLWLRDRGMLIGSGGLVGCVYVEHSTEV